MFTVNAVFYNGKIHNHTKKVKKVIEGKWNHFKRKISWGEFHQP